MSGKGGVGKTSVAANLAIALSKKGARVSLMDMDVFRLIENMSGFVCPHCGKSIDLFGTGGGFRTATAMNIPFLGRIPVDDRMVKCADAGKSYMEKYQDSEATKEFNQVVAKILNQG